MAHRNRLILSAFILLSGTASADPIVCGPNLTTDGVAIKAGCPGNTYQAIVEPSSFALYFNDNPVSQGINANGGAGDADFNDIWVTGTITPTSNPLRDAVTFQFGGALAAWTNKIFIGSVGVGGANRVPVFAGDFAVGSALPITGLAGGDGDIYFGNSALNPDQVLAFYETQSFDITCAAECTDPTGVPDAPLGHNPVPEPGAVWLMALVLASVLTAKACGWFGWFRVAGCERAERRENAWHPDC